MKILAVGDSYMPPSYFADGFAGLEAGHEIEYFQVDAERPFAPESDSERRLKEYQGSPAELVERIPGFEVLAVQGAPVTDAVLEASKELKLVGCARGGPVNVDIAAATERGIPVVTSPGKNAEAVADQTLAFMVMLARGFPRAQGFLSEGGQLASNWEGARFMGHDLGGHTLGLVGYGQVGQRVAERARAFGMRVLVYDPFVELETVVGVEQCGSLEQLLDEADFVSLHARATKENADLFDAPTFAKMKPGSYFVNTARETLVDETALDEALASGRLAGAALDIVKAQESAGRHPLLRHENVVLTPHIGGATHETLLHGARMIADEIARFAAGEPLVNVANRTAVRV